ncbi:MAG: hypothetical protein KF861_07245 [Planctomycetaceae bacterium]|nr:hypothetical protein [Planctomycetaceae bacterium]
MDRMEIDRRSFAKWTAAAFGGVVAGAVTGCGQKASTDPTADSAGAEPEAGNAAASDADGTTTHDIANLLVDAHVCRGLNTCQGKGKGGENSCAGQGACAIAEAHTCHFENACKGQGGCGELPGQNSCKGKGECAVPLHEGAWEKARAAFEEAMKVAGKTYGEAPNPG